MKNNDLINKIILGNSLEILSDIKDNSIDIVLTDPPYFLDKLDNNWEYKKVENTKNQHTIKSLPAGMKFDRKQGQEFYKWYLIISQQIYRILKPGGFFFSFSSPRLYHRMASAIDDAGLEIRDCFLWLYTQNQAKAMSINHFIDKMKISEKEKVKLKKKFKGWKTPQLKSCFEPIVMSQKSTDETYLNNMIKNNIGLMNTNIKVGDNMFPSNVLTVDNINEIIDKSFLIGKPTKKEKGDFNNHKTVKPLEICEHIIKLTAFYKNAVILDPFVGSGTTAIAAKKLGLNYIGIDANPEYVKISEIRLSELDKKVNLFSKIKKEKLINNNLQTQLQFA
ncbi:MAG: site-specific DNA-methyltransferase [Patescibacteria group bacterium]|nr:site-specific DNA-methyltransferase [Patescibacteria group bacterium]